MGAAVILDAGTDFAQANVSQIVVPDPLISRVLADTVLVLHVGIAAFVVFGLVVTVVGNIRGWRSVDNLWFRLAHLSAIGIVVTEAWLGFVCPLTTLEMRLRVHAGGSAYANGFIEHWLQALLFYSAPPWVFVAAYSLFGLAVLATWCLFPPRRPRAHRPHATWRGSSRLQHEEGQ